MEEKEMMENENTADLFADDEMTVQKAKNVKATMKRFLRDLLKQKWKLLVVFLCLAVSTACTIASPMLIGEAINQIFEGIKNAAQTGTAFSVNIGTMGGIAALLLAVYLLGALFNYFPQYILASVSQKMALNMRKASVQN